MVSASQYREANKAGLRHRETGEMWSYYTKTLQIAYNLGLDNVDIADCKEVTGFRFGGCPDNHISHNYAENKSENGLSVYLDGMTVRAEFEERGNMEEFTGIQVDTGSDGEAIILAFEAEYLD